MLLERSVRLSQFKVNFMEYTAIAKNITISPRKVRLVAESIKKSALPSALSYLSVMDKRAAMPVKKAIESALANAVNNGHADKNVLFIKEITINEGIRYKRYHYAGRGRIRPYKKRTSHIRVILGTKLPIKVREESTEKSVTKSANIKDEK